MAPALIIPTWMGAVKPNHRMKQCEAHLSPRITTVIRKVILSSLNSFLCVNTRLPRALLSRCTAAYIRSGAQPWLKPPVTAASTRPLLLPQHKLLASEQQTAAFWQNSRDRESCLFLALLNCLKIHLAMAAK